MRFMLENGVPVPVTKIEADGRIITNPTDEAVDEAGAGYPLKDNPAPEYNPDTQKKPTAVWTLIDGAIEKIWTVEDYTEDELKDRRNAGRMAQIEQNNADFELKKSEPITYANGKGYLPRWLVEFYIPLLTLGEAAFPQNVMAADGTVDSFTYEEFKTLTAFLIQEFGKITAETNAENARIQAEMEE